MLERPWLPSMLPEMGKLALPYWPLLQRVHRDVGVSPIKYGSVARISCRVHRLVRTGRSRIGGLSFGSQVFDFWPLVPDEKMKQRWALAARTVYGRGGAETSIGTVEKMLARRVRAVWAG